MTLRLHTHLVDVEVRYLQELVPIFCHFWDLDVQLQILDWKVAKVLDLRDNTGVNYFHAELSLCHKPKTWWMVLLSSHLESEVERTTGDSRLLQRQLRFNLVPSWI